MHIPIVIGHFMFDKRLREEDAGGVDQQADILMLCIDVRHNLLHTGLARQVSDDNIYLPRCRQRLARPFGLFPAIAHQHHAAAILHHPFGRRQPHTAGSANHEQFFPINVVFIIHLFTFACMASACLSTTALTNEKK